MLILVTGGSASGKSEYAEHLAFSLSEGKKYYIATMFPYDEESKHRIIRHRAMREDKNFETIECFYRLKNLKLPEKKVLLLECVSNLTANEIYMPEGSKKNIADEIVSGIKNLNDQGLHTIVVTNEVFSSGLYYDENTIKYLEILGTINKEIAVMADRVVEVVYSIPVVIKGGTR